jgi:hypothetical protein
MGPWRPPAAGSVSYWPDDRKHVFPYGFDPLELKGRDLRREKQNAAATPMACAGSITSDTGHNRAGQHAGKPFTQHLK